MDELVKTFHIDIKLLIAQTINFAVVVWVLYRFAYKPLLKHMNERSDVIKRGLEDAKIAQEHLEQAEKEREKKILDAKTEAKKILEESKKQAEENRTETIEKTKQEAEKVVALAKKEIDAEKDKMINDIKKEIGGLVVESTKKVLGEELDIEIQRKIIKKTVNNI